MNIIERIGNAVSKIPDHDTWSCQVAASLHGHRLTTQATVFIHFRSARPIWMVQAATLARCAVTIEATAPLGPRESEETFLADAAALEATGETREP